VEHVLATLSLAALALMGLLWLSLVATAWLALVIPAPLSAAIAGGALLLIAAAAFFNGRSTHTQRKPAPSEDETKATKSDDLISRLKLISQGMVADAPWAPLAFASLAGFAAVGLPENFGPYLSSILDDVEKVPDDPDIG
jgi:uncharacterized membrane protein